MIRIALALTLLAGAGCARRSMGPSGKLPVVELHLYSLPVAVNIDSQPGADGVAVKIYGGNPQAPGPVPIRDGSLEILMFDGIVRSMTTNTVPLHVWAFEASELRPFEAQTTIGVSYNLTLSWGTDQPAQNRITVVARHHRANGPAVYSAPSHLSVVTR